MYLFIGIGYETAKFIAMMGAEVIIACRSQEKAKLVTITIHTLLSILSYP